MICFVISTLRAGGAERVISCLANTFEDTAIITLMPSSENSAYPLKNHVKLFCLGDGLSSPIISSPPFVLCKALWRVRRQIQDLRPSVIVSFLDRVNIATLLLTRGLDIPVIVSERIDPHFHDIGKISRFLRKMTYPWAKHVVCQTQNAANYFSYPVTVIPNPVPPATYIKETYGPLKNLVSVGRLEPQKDHKTLIQALEDFPNLALTIYGEGILHKELEYYRVAQEASSLYPYASSVSQGRGIDPMASRDFFIAPTLPSLSHKRKNLDLPGVVKDIDEALCKADLFVFPSLYEGFPNALCEAMRVGLPVIASDCSGNRDIVQHGVNGLLFPVGNVRALQEQIRYMIQNPKEVERMGKNARNIVKNYSVEEVMQKWKSLL